jgi:hypothetical protein
MYMCMLREINNIVHDSVVGKSLILSLTANQQGLKADGEIRDVATTRSETSEYGLLSYHKMCPYYWYTTYHFGRDE